LPPYYRRYGDIRPYMAQEERYALYAEAYAADAARRYVVITR